MANDKKKLVIKEGCIPQFMEMCMPIVDYLKENGDIYTEVHISVDEIKITSVECGLPLNK